MRSRSSGALRRLASIRLMMHRHAFLLLGAAAFVLMLLTKANVGFIEQSRVAVVDAFVPVLDLLSRPATLVAEGTRHIRELVALRAENARLKAENQRLLHWETIASRLRDENQVLLQQLNVVPDPDPAYITARVVGDMGSAYVHSMVVNAGARDGVRKGQAVLSGETLIGHVAEVGDRSARLQLLTDPNSRLPVMIEGSRTRAILAGDGRERPRLGYIAGNPNIQVGDRVVTSASGAAFPPGLPIGVVASIAEGGPWVEPDVHRHELEYVAIVDYGLGGILPFADKPQAPVRRRPAAAGVGPAGTGAVPGGGDN